MNNLVEIDRISKHYDTFDLRDVSITVPAGSVVGFIGGNGAGKTTTLKALLGLISIDSGSIEVLGTEASEAFSSRSAATLKPRIGTVFDACTFPEDITVKDAGAIMRHAYPNWEGATFQHYCALFSLESRKKIKDLSRGMGMKLMMACALSHNPDLLILDEATAGLDPLARDEMLAILHRFMRDETHGILMSSHITSDLEKIADYIVCIEAGRIIFAVEKDAITERAGVARCREDEFADIAASGVFAPGTMRYLQHEYAVDVLVPDRLGFAQRFGSVALDRAGIDEYMALMLKGGTR